MAARAKKRIVPIIVGPTGVGKTYLSTLLAEKLPLEIISADSRQIYKYLDIGTAKPSKDVRAKIPHHFVDILAPDHFYSAGEFGKDARKCIDDILGKGKIPCVVGGSGLYVKALLEGFFPDDVRDDKIRESLQQRLQNEGPEALYYSLQAADPASAKKNHPNNTQRVIRALEVYLASGAKLSDLQMQKTDPPNFTPLKFGINKERKQLYRDTNTRVEQMFLQGLLAEVANILNKGYNKHLNSLNTVGYKEVIQYLEGNITYDECIRLVKRNSRRYAKRQLTWLRSDADIYWFQIESRQDYLVAANKIYQSYNKAKFKPNNTNELHSII